MSNMTMEEIVAIHLDCIIETCDRQDVDFTCLLSTIRQHAVDAKQQLEEGDPIDPGMDEGD